MQYLSRAYQYYSGINPATLTGAIDVIVVKKTDEDGNVSFSSSPFHVRFGKLQVLRAGEKKVTLSLPGNLPEPHIAPFWMKVGEAGEAFFVVETEEEVPEELQTSPVISAADADAVRPLTDADFAQDGNAQAEASGSAGQDPPGSQEESRTQEPFGSHDIPVEKADAVHTEPTFLDLNEEQGKESQPGQSSGKDGLQPSSSSSSLSSISSSAILSSASALVPSFLHSSKPSDASSSDPDPHALPPNPLEGETNPSERKHRAETLRHYVRSHRHKAARSMSIGASDRDGAGADSVMPKVQHGEGEPPHITYKDDLVLDMAGYHQAPSEGESESGDTPRTVKPKASAPSTSDKALMPSLADPPTWVGEMSAGTSNSSKARLIAFAQDLLASAGSSASDLTGQWSKAAPGQPKSEINTATSQRAVIEEIERRFVQLDVIEKTPRARTQLLVEDDRRRGASEPPPDLSEAGPSSDIPPPPYEQPVQDYTWEWGGFPMKTPLPRDQAFFEPEVPVVPPLPEVASAPNLTHIANERRSSEPAVSGDVNLNDDGAVEGDRPGMPRLATEPATAQAGSHGYKNALAQPLGRPGKLKNDEDDPYRFVLEMGHQTHSFGMSVGDEAMDDTTSGKRNGTRVTFQRFIQDPKIVESPDLVLHFESFDLTWQNAAPVLASLIIYRKSLLPPAPAAPADETLPPLSDLGMAAGDVPPAASKGYGWSRWWRRSQTPNPPSSAQLPSSPVLPSPTPEKRTDVVSPVTPPVSPPVATDAKADNSDHKVYYAKTLRLTSEQLAELNLKSGANTITFSVNSSYSGQASCTARIFLWDESDNVVISDIDGTITKSDALGHVFAAIGRDWTHLGVAKLYTDITNNGYKIMYLTSRAIGQADSTRDYLKSISQGNYQLPDGPVIMSPDRLMASLHREVIMRKPELFKMACLRDIQRLFGGKNAFYAGFGNRITDAMSYRSVNVPSSRIFTIDSGGEVKMELLELAGYKSSYIHMTDLVDQMFPPIHRTIAPAYTDFNYWREAIPDIPIPDLAPPSPALSARSDGSGRLSVLRNLTTGLGRRSSKQPVASSSSNGRSDQTSRPSSPLVGPAITAEPDSDVVSEDEDFWDDRRSRQGSSMPGSLPGSYNDRGDYLADDYFDRNTEQRYHAAGNGNKDAYDHAEEARRFSEDDDDVDPEMFDDDILATGEMSKVPF